MNALCKSLAALALTALLASPAFAQGRGGMGMGGNPVMLLGNASVQKELKLDDKQIDEAKNLASESREKMQAAFQDAQGLEGDARREKMQEITKQLNEESRPKIGAILKSDQVKRLHQIVLQQQGVRAFNEEHVQKALKITDDQKDKFKSLMADMQTQMRELFTAGGDAQERREKMTAMNKEFNEKGQALLTDDQKKSYKEMLGSPFTVVFERPGGN